MIYRFTIEKEGRVFECEREVTGTAVQHQTVRVIGQGTKVDPSSYGKKTISGATMELVARMIAGEIVARI